MDEGIGTLGLSPDVFWLLTWADLNRLLEAHVYNHNQHWDRTRYQSTMIANCAMGKKRTIKPKDLFKLPHDIDFKRKHHYLQKKRWTGLKIRQFNYLSNIN